MINGLYFMDFLTSQLKHQRRTTAQRLTLQDSKVACKRSGGARQGGVG
jgi:hypothetical protein